MAYFKRAKIIEKKRSGQQFTADEIDYPMNYHSTPDGNQSRISNLFINSVEGRLDQDETTQSIKEMFKNASVLPWPEEWIHIITDTIGTTGLRNMVDLVLAPALAAVGLKVAVISGRSIGYTGKFVNNLESIPGFSVCLNLKAVYQILNASGCCVVGKTEDFDPADKILHQCQIITGDVQCSPQIVVTIVSKNRCEEITALLYDIKYGKGTIFSTKMEAEETAGNLVKHSKLKKTAALLTSMEKSFGRRIGNSAEIAEIILCLKGHGIPDFMQFVCALGCELLQLIRCVSKEAGTKMIMDVIKNGTALGKFHSMIIHQGVVPEIAHLLCYTNGYFILPKTLYETDIIYDGEDGFVQEINLLYLAMIYKEVSAKCKHDPGVGLMLLKRVGDKIKKDEIWIKINHQGNVITVEMQTLLKSAISVGEHHTKIILID